MNCEGQVELSSGRIKFILGGGLDFFWWGRTIYRQGSEDTTHFAASAPEGAPAKYRPNQVLLCSSLELFYEVGLIVPETIHYIQVSIATPIFLRKHFIDIVNHV